jgi:zinc protease
MRSKYSILCLLLVFICSCSYEPPPPVKDLIVGKISKPIDSEKIDFEPTTPEIWHLENGMKVMYIFNDELPLVKGSFVFKGGEFWESDTDFGSASLMTSLLRQGGAGNLSAKELDRRLEELSAKITSSMSSPIGTVSFKCLDRDLGDVWSLFSDVILRPRFEAERMGLLKEQLVESLERRNDNPQLISEIAIDNLVFGDSILGRNFTAQSVKSIYLPKIKRAYQRFVRPENSILVISGRVTKSELEDLLSEELVYLKPLGETLGEPESLIPPPKPRIVYLPAQISQATVSIGQLGVPYLTNDDFAIKLFNEIFSGGMDSRLFREVRTKAGLAYSVWGGINQSFIIGKNSISLQTRSSQTGRALIESLNVLKRLQRDEPSEEELSSKKKGKSNSFLFSSSTPEVILSRRAMLEMLGFPEGYDENYLQNVESVTTKDIIQVANKRWDFDSLIFLIVGDQEALDSFLNIKDSLPEPYRSLPIERGYFKDKFYLN